MLGPSDLTVIVTTCRQPTLLFNCVETMLKHIPGTYRVIVADSDEYYDGPNALDRCCRQLGVEVVHFRENVWPHGATNRLADRITSRFICSMQDDLLFVPGIPQFWHSLVEVAAWPNVAIVGPCSNKAEGYAHILRADLPNRVFSHYVNGFMHVMEVAKFKGLGMYDTSTLSYCIDLCIRAHLREYSLVIDRTVYVHHRAGGTLHGDSDARGAVGHMADDTHNDMIRKHGVRVYRDYLARSTEKECVLAAYGSGPWQHIDAAFSQPPRMAKRT